MQKFEHLRLPRATVPTIGRGSQPQLRRGDVGEWLKPVPC